MTDTMGAIDRGPGDTRLAGRIMERLGRNGVPEGWAGISDNDKSRGSAVLFLITSHQIASGKSPEPCLVLNKRSAQVIQPGDLCCPGGGVDRIDGLLANLMRWPGSPLRKWPLWKNWQTRHPRTSRWLAHLFATGLREGWEEMRLNPLRVRFLGCLPVHNLIMFKRHIYPLVGWMGTNLRLVPNWEVERIVHIPLRGLMDEDNYCRYQLSFHSPEGVLHRRQQFPCYVHQDHHGREVLWGATFRITMDFLRLVFGFELPDLKDAPVIDNQLGQAYLNGSRMARDVQGHREQDEDF